MKRRPPPLPPPSPSSRIHFDVFGHWTDFPEDLSESSSWVRPHIEAVLGKIIARILTIGLAVHVQPGATLRYEKRLVHRSSIFVHHSALPGETPPADIHREIANRVNTVLLETANAPVV